MGEVVCVCGRGHPDVSRSSDGSVVSRCAGFRRSIEMLSVRPFGIIFVSSFNDGVWSIIGRL